MAMAYGQTNNSWGWAFSTLLQDAINQMNLHPYRVIGYPEVEVTDRPEKRATKRVTVTFEIEHQI